MTLYAHVCRSKLAFVRRVKSYLTSVVLKAWHLSGSALCCFHNMLGVSEQALDRIVGFL